MAWDFSTDPEFQEKLDWIEQFCKEKVEPLDYVFPYAVRSPDPVVKSYVRELQQEVKDQGLWAVNRPARLHHPRRRLRQQRIVPIRSSWPRRRVCRLKTSKPAAGTAGPRLSIPFGPRAAIRTSSIRCCFPVRRHPRTGPPQSR